MTPRQAEFLALYARGYKRAEIAEQCFVSPKTVSVTIDDAKARMGARTLVQCVAKSIALEHLILDHNGDVFVPSRSLVSA